MKSIKALAAVALASSLFIGCEEEEHFGIDSSKPAPYENGTINGSFGGAFDTLPGAACLYAGGDCKEPRKVAEAILREAERLQRDGIDPNYWQRTLRAAFGSTLRGLNSFENIAVGLAEGHFQGYDALRFPRVYESIQPEDILAFLRQNVREDRMALSRILPADEQEKEGTDA